MKHWQKVLLLPLLYVTECLGQINANGDFQIWQKNILKNHFNPKWAFATTEEQRWGDNASKLYHVYLQGQIVYQQSKWLSITPGYRQTLRRFPLNSTRWIFEYSPMADLSLNGEVYGWELKDRNRVEYIISQSSPFPWLYRNRLRIVTPCKMTRLNFTPFIDTEIFIRQGEGFNQYRLSGGLFVLIYGNFSGQISYTARFEKATPHWTHQNILNLNLLLSY